MNQHFVVLYWKALRLAIKKANVLLFFVAIVFSFSFLKISESKDQFLYLSKDAWFSVLGSMCAATLFLVVQFVLTKVISNEKTVYELKYYEYEKINLKEIFLQRGSSEICEKYLSLTKKAQKRIWAIGMTNRHILKQHETNIINALMNKKVDVVLSFWNPKTDLVIPNHDGSETRKKILDIQQNLEAGASGANWEKTLFERQMKIIEKLPIGDKMQGSMRIINLSLPTNFTCFVIDDNLFFFPFLSGPESTNDPTIHCGTNDGVGKRLLEHITTVLSDKSVAETIYHRDGGNEAIINRLKLNGQNNSI